MRKQTAVEWLVDELRKHIQEYGRLDAITIYQLKIKAKALEKEQIIDSYENGEAEWTPFEFKTAKDYYTSTFGS
jgi:hypothetical protein